jgi:hypothetical protein
LRSFVPRDLTFSRFKRRLPDDPIFRFPFFAFLAMGVGAAALGTARATLNDFDALAGMKIPQGYTRPLADRPATQKDVARSEAALRSARSFFYEAIGTAWDSAARGAVPTGLRHDLRLATTHAVSAASQRLVGLSAFANPAPLSGRPRYDSTCDCEQSDV